VLTIYNSWTVPVYFGWCVCTWLYATHSRTPPQPGFRLRLDPNTNE